jgi:hypothetical protein
MFQGILVLKKEMTLNVPVSLEPKNEERPLILTSMKGAFHELGSIFREFGPKLSRQNSSSV